MANKKELKRILDFPCGHGRALRYLRAAYPDADIFVSDINEPGVEFCRTQFGARPFRSYVELENTELTPSMDLIWCGSLLTHLDERRSKLLIHKFLMPWHRKASVYSPPMDAFIRVMFRRNSRSWSGAGGTISCATIIGRDMVITSIRGGRRRNTACR
ncbi:class I SAM-dependent methyltransferase [Neorhizobium huautlense]